MKRNTFLAIVPVLLAACSSGGPLEPGGETHFMKPCGGGENTCGEGYECVCGTCTLTCFTDNECGDTPGESLCLNFDRTPDYGSCSIEGFRKPGVCIPSCEEDAECHVWGLEYCIDGGCSAAELGEEAVLVPDGPLVGTEGPIGIGTAPVFAATQGQLFLASPAHLMRSTDGGRTWDEVAAERAIAFVDLEGALFAAFEEQGLVASLDGGRSWHSAGARGLDGTVVELVAGAAELYAIAGDRDSSGRSLLFASSDAAETWTALSPLPRSEAVGALFAAHDVLVATGLYSGGLFRSTDGGSSWSPVDAGLAGWSTEIVEFQGSLFAMAPGRSSVFRSTDRGLTWSETILPADELNVSSLPLLMAAGTDLFAVPGSGGVFRWHAERWVEARGGLSGGRITGLAGGAAGAWLGAGELLYRWSSTSTTWAEVDLDLVETNVVALAEEAGVLLASSGGDAVHLSYDGGATWSRSGSGLPANSSVVQLGLWAGRSYASTEGDGIFVSNDGLEWMPGNVGVPALPGEARPAVVSAFAYDGATTWAATTDRSADGKLGVGVLRTENGGEKWELARSGLPLAADEAFESIPALLFVDDVLYAGTAGSGVFKSLDRGATWTKASEGLPVAGDRNETVTGLVQAKDGLLATVSLPAAGGTALFWSADQGGSWVPLGETVAFAGEVRSIASRSGLIAVSVVQPDGSGALYASIDGGVSWTPSSKSVVPGPVVVANDALFVGTQQAGVWRLGLSVQVPE